MTLTPDDIALMKRRLHALSIAVRDARRTYPGADYAGRVYYCDVCRGFDFAVAPLDELPDDYPCPCCGTPQCPVTPPGLGPVGNREERRRQARSRG